MVSLTRVDAPSSPSSSPEPPPRRPSTFGWRAAAVMAWLGRAMILTGIVLFLFVGYQIWGTDIQEARAQNDLRDELEFTFASAGDLSTLFAVPETTVTTTTEPASLVSTTTAAVAEPSTTTEPLLTPPSADVGDRGAAQRDVVDLLFPESGDALARLVMPTIDIDKVVVSGVAVADLRKGPGHYTDTALPGTEGNAAIAGHRTTYGAPFNRIDELQPDDEITVVTAAGQFTYRVLPGAEAFADRIDDVDAVQGGHIIVKPSATWVLGDFGDNRLTLTACHPKLSARQRIIVAAELVEDAVEIPEWVLEARQERLLEVNAGGDLATTDPTAGDESTVTDPDPTGTDDPVIDDATDQTTTTPAAAADLDEGLNGERDAIAPAVAWLFAALLLWWGAGRIGRRTQGRTARVLWRLTGLAPALFCLWFAFELIDRALPAG